MTNKQLEILFICGSPRSHASEALLALLEQGVRDTGARSRRFLLSKKYIAPCKGCGWCEKTGSCVLAKKQDDDYLELLEALRYADALAIVTPLYFAGPPAQLKAVYDRMQPFWSRTYILGQASPPKRPAQIFILGGGGDDHGYEPLVTISKSALAVAGFSLEKTQNFIGFRHASDVKPLPRKEEAAEMAFGELAHLRKATAAQKEFELRAVSAGSAFARFVSNAKEKAGSQLKTQQTEENIKALPVERTVARPLNEDIRTTDLAPEIINHVDSGFESLKQAARAAKASKKEGKDTAEEAISEYVAAIEDQNPTPDSSSAQTEDALFSQESQKE